MKTNHPFTFFAKMTICFSALFLNSCQKELSQNPDKPASAVVVQSHTKVDKWLDNQKLTANSHKMTVLENLMKNLVFESMHFEKLNDSERLIIIPIAPGFKSEVNKGKNCINNLLLIEDPSGKIRKGNIVEFIPKNNSGFTVLPVNSFYDLYNKGKIDTDGRLAFLNLNDKLLYQMDYSNGKLTSYGEKQGNNGTVNPGKENTSNTGGTYVDWYLVTTYYYTDGSTEEISEYLYTTFYEDNYFETIYYELLNDGILNGNGDPETIMSPKQVDWLVLDIDNCVTSNPGNLFFQLFSTERLYGTKKASEPQGGHFTQIEHLGELISGQAQFTWVKSGATVAHTPSIARSTLSGEIRKANASFYLLQSKSHDFTFSVVFP